LLLDKIPESIRLSMIQFNEKDQLEWTVKDFLKRLEKDIAVTETHIPLTKSTGGITTAEKSRIRPSSSSQATSEVGTANTLFTMNERKCVYCQEDHFPENCEKVKSVEEHKSVLKKSAKCFLCLTRGHRVYSCRSKSHLQVL